MNRYNMSSSSHHIGNSSVKIQSPYNFKTDDQNQHENQDLLENSFYFIDRPNDQDPDNLNDEAINSVSKIQTNHPEENEGQNVIKQNVQIFPNTANKNVQNNLDNLKNTEHQKSKNKNFIVLEAKQNYPLEEIKKVSKGGINTKKFEENFKAKKNIDSQVLKRKKRRNRDKVIKKVSKEKEKGSIEIGRDVKDEHNELSPDENEIYSFNDLSQKKNSIDLFQNEHNELSKEKKKGRIKKDSNEEGQHNKFSPGNSAKKCESNFDNSMLDLVNSFLQEDEKLIKINYKELSNNINKEEKLKVFGMKLCEIFAEFKICSLYNKKEGKTNKTEKIIEGENEIKNKKLRSRTKPK